MFNPYSVFDVPQNADFELLRATYRRLARENHPDVALDKVSATERMAQINRAWAILSDNAKRASFDATLRREIELKTERDRRQEVRRPTARAKTAQSSDSAPRVAKNSANVSSKTGKRAGIRGRSKIAARETTRPKPSGAWDESTSPRALRLMRRITLASRVWHRDGNAKSAIEMCRAVLLADGRNVPARELLSEIFVAQGRLEVAVMMLDQAIQLSPDDLFLRRKRDHLERGFFPGGEGRPIARPSLWQRLRAKLLGKIS